jgi:hypothetical protein
MISAVALALGFMLLLSGGVSEKRQKDLNQELPRASKLGSLENSSGY